jgi:hypothetical protein
MSDKTIHAIAVGSLAVEFLAVSILCYAKGMM